LQALEAQLREVTAENKALRAKAAHSHGSGASLVGTHDATSSLLTTAAGPHPTDWSRSFAPLLRQLGTFDSFLTLEYHTAGSPAGMTTDGHRAGGAAAMDVTSGQPAGVSVGSGTTLLLEGHPTGEAAAGRVRTLLQLCQQHASMWQVARDANRQRTVDDVIRSVVRGLGTLLDVLPSAVNVFLVRFVFRSAVG
jgi:hypothetical protein